MNLKITFAFLTMILFLSSASLQAKNLKDSIKTRPKYEYAFLYLNTNIWVPDFKIIYENGQIDKLENQKLPKPSSDLVENSDLLFKAFNYLSSSGYELVTALGSEKNGWQYTFKREKK